MGKKYNLSFIFYRLSVSICNSATRMMHAEQNFMEKMRSPVILR